MGGECFKLGTEAGVEAKKRLKRQKSDQQLKKNPQVM